VQAAKLAPVYAWMLLLSRTQLAVNISPQQRDWAVFVVTAVENAMY